MNTGAGACGLFVRIIIPGHPGISCGSWIISVVMEIHGHIKKLWKLKNGTYRISKNRLQTAFIKPDKKRLIQNTLLGLTLHPFDLAANKMLALVGRLEVRDWVDLIYCHERISRLGYLAWAACGKDPGFSPESLLEQAARSGTYSRDELNELSFENETALDASDLNKKWREMLRESHLLIQALPAGETGKCLLDKTGAVYSGTCDELKKDLADNHIVYHRGSICVSCYHRITT